ncbi:phytanoyl-CoA dioxygenase family protein [Pontibacter cellulosilyticus]|uniref:Phytanoyl-CoA dioxygenase family protein n=1 Tax=Pontibacter cellulosilyticus TaxID=1720253 RepID=A0A923N5V7_9BACT|nr:phytanoyl-CoA dioxygenase family protein [Pontibacter cellulosilyticus]MBC5992778.1 phytanoyl-CoA dioxygenase family protein [Pontibacter cellulosilyticus]
MGFIDKYTGKLRTYKAVYTLNNILQYKKLKHNKALYKKYKLDQSIYSPISSSILKQLPPQPSPWLDAPDAAQKLKVSQQLEQFAQELQGKIKAWPDNGFLSLEGFFGEEEVDKVNTEIDKLLESHKVDFNYTNKKIMFAFRHSEALKAILYTPALTSILEFILGRQVIPFQTINFIKGSEQLAHSDSIHMTTHPLGNLIAVWIALEDTDKSNGPLFYYPGSHKLPYILNDNFEGGNTKYRIGDFVYKKYEEKVQQVVKEEQLQKKTFYAKKGDVFIWHANLLHGGSPVLNPESTRKSMVIHYYAKDVICYHEITQRPALISNYPISEVQVIEMD